MNTDNKNIKTDVELYVIDMIRKQREEKGFTQEALSYALNFSRTFISKYENGPRKYNTNHLNNIAKVLKCSPKDFLPEKPL